MNQNKFTRISNSKNLKNKYENYTNVGANCKETHEAN